jgi:hypothetical protein
MPFMRVTGISESNRGDSRRPYTARNYVKSCTTVISSVLAVKRVLQDEERTKLDPDRVRKA